MYWSISSRGWGDSIGHFWTIAVEAQFYPLWPFALGGLGRSLPRLLVFWQRLVYHLMPDSAGRALFMGPLPVVLALLPVLVLLGAASWYWVEAPIDRVKKRFRYAGLAPS